ncbi:MAG: hypothetical protein WCO33_02220 [bacterium]
METQAQPVQPVNTPPVSQSQNPIQEKKGSALKTVLIVLGVLLVLCVLCTVCGVVGTKIIADRTATLGTDLGNKALDGMENFVTSRMSDTINSAGSSLLAPDASQNGSTSSSNGLNGIVGSGTALPDGFPTDVPLMAGYKVISTSSQTVNNIKVMTVMLSIARTADDVKNYYKTELTNSGWKYDTGSFLFITSYTGTKGTRKLTVSVTGGTDTTKPNSLITISIQ